MVCGLSSGGLGVPLPAEAGSLYTSMPRNYLLTKSEPRWKRFQPMGVDATIVLSSREMPDFHSLNFRKLKKEI